MRLPRLLKCCATTKKLLEENHRGTQPSGLVLAIRRYFVGKEGKGRGRGRGKGERGRGKGEAWMESKEILGGDGVRGVVGFQGRANLGLISGNGALD